MANIGEIKWIKEKGKWNLVHGEELLLSLGTQQSGARPMYLEGRSFQIIKAGIWRPIVFIQTENKDKILQMKSGFWSSTGKISFRDGSIYTCDFKNMAQLRLIISDPRYGDNLFSFRSERQADGKHIPQMVFHQKEILTDKLLFLLALGMDLFLHYHQDDVDLTTFLLLTSA